MFYLDEGGPSFEDVVAAWLEVTDGTVARREGRFVDTHGPTVNGTVFDGVVDADEPPVFVDVRVVPGRGVLSTFLDVVERLRAATGWDVKYDDEDISAAKSADEARSGSIRATA